MAKLSSEATIGLGLEVLLAILERLHVHEPWIIWGLFVVGLVLIGDSIVRGEWADKITDRERRRKKRIRLGVIAIVAFVLFGVWIFARIHAEERPKVVIVTPSPMPQTALPEAPGNKTPDPAVPDPGKRSNQSTKKTGKREPSPPVKAPQQPTMTQDCGGGNCAQSSGQTGGVTAGQIINVDTDRQLTLKQITDIGASRTACLNLPFINVTASSDEAKRYASQFVSALRKAGCRADLSLPIPGLRPDVTGIFIGVRDMNKIDPSASALGTILSGANVLFSFGPMEPDFFPGVAFVLVIGAKGSPTAVSYGQHGGITAGVVNLGPPQPKLTWTQEVGKLSASGKPTVIIKLTVDRALDEPAFLATCNHPCSVIDGGIPIGFSQAQPIHKNDDVLMAGLVLRTPPVLGAGIVLSMTLESQDGQALTISDVSKVPMSDVPPVKSP